MKRRAFLGLIATVPAVVSHVGSIEAGAWVERREEPGLTEVGVPVGAYTVEQGHLTVKRWGHLLFRLVDRRLRDLRLRSTGAMNLWLGSTVNGWTFDRGAYLFLENVEVRDGLVAMDVVLMEGLADQLSATLRTQALTLTAAPEIPPGCEAYRYHNSRLAARFVSMYDIRYGDHVFRFDILGATA